MNNQAIIASDKDEGMLEQNISSQPVAPHPWRRFFARLIDVWVFGVIALVLLVVLWRMLSPASVPTNFLVLLVMMKLVYGGIEAFCLSRFGATPGKWLFGIRVVRLGGGLLSFSQALTRYLLVWVQGEWFGVPLLAVVPYYIAYRRLGKTGGTAWDAAESVQSRVTHKKWGLLRALACTVAVLGVLVVYGTLNALTQI